MFQQTYEGLKWFFGQQAVSDYLWPVCSGIYLTFVTAAYIQFQDAKRHALSTFRREFMRYAHPYAPAPTTAREFAVYIDNLLIELRYAIDELEEQGHSASLGDVPIALHDFGGTCTSFAVRTKFAAEENPTAVADAHYPFQQLVTKHVLAMCSTLERCHPDWLTVFQIRRALRAFDAIIGKAAKRECQLLWRYLVNDDGCLNEHGKFKQRYNDDHRYD